VSFFFFFFFFFFVTRFRIQEVFGPGRYRLAAELIVASSVENPGSFMACGWNRLLRPRGSFPAQAIIRAERGEQFALFRAAPSLSGRQNPRSETWAIEGAPAPGALRCRRLCDLLREKGGTRAGEARFLVTGQARFPRALWGGPAGLNRFSFPGRGGPLLFF